MSSTRRGRRAAALLVLLVLALLAASCGGDDGGDADGTTTTSTTSSSTTSTTTTTEPVGPVMPLTGLSAGEADPEAGAVLVKIGNNNESSRPQFGIHEADIVYEEFVENAKTRFAAVFHSQLPDILGPIRSGRTSDFDLVHGLGVPGFASSGGNPTVLGALRNASNAGDLVDVGWVWRESYYHRIADRAAPYNLVLSTVDNEVRGENPPTPQFVYGSIGTLGQTIGGVSVKYPPAFGRESVHLWDADLAAWVRVQDGTLHTVIDGADDDGQGGTEVEIAPTNVVLASVTYGVSPADPSSPEAESFGMGPAQVFTQGREIQGTWSRTTDNPIWDLRTVSGDPIPLAPGPTWVLLVADADSRFATGDISTFSRADASAMLAEAREAYAESTAAG